MTLAGALALPRLARAQTCLPETECRFEKPNVIVIMDYSSSMTDAPFGDRTRWEAQVDAVRALLADSELTDDLHLALMRFGYDPSAGTGTTVAGDTSSPPITDGIAWDARFDDPGGSYLECNAGSLLSVVEALPPPPAGVSQMGTWTRGALEAAGALVDATRAAHPEDESRLYEIVLLTDGDWNCKHSLDRADCDGDPATERDDDPLPIATLLSEVGVRVHVVAFGDAATATALDDLAQAGGTGAAIDAGSPEELARALSAAVTEVKDAVVVPECVGGLPRVMVLMDASSSMLVGTDIGETNWDKARFSLAGNPDAPSPSDPGYVRPLFERTLSLAGRTVAIEDVVHIGLAAFNLPDVQQLMLQYAPCARDNIEWAMHPRTSCEAPGCVDPYSDPDAELTWTFKSSDVDRVPPFIDPTRSFMPSCNPGGAARCEGAVFNTYTGEGLAFIRDNIGAFKAAPGAYTVGTAAPFVNILVTDGRTSPDSTDPRPILSAMAAFGVPTHVIGFGSASDLDVPTLDDYAAAGATGSAITVDPADGDSADALADRMAAIIGGLDIDVCCQLNDCSEMPEPAFPLCGNGKVDPGEACDAGEANGTPEGGCSAACHAVEAYCGDGITQQGELCDDGNQASDDGCRSDCSGSCGDGIVAGAEACDDQNADDLDGCRADCTAEAGYWRGSAADAGSAGGGTAGSSGATGGGASTGSGATGTGPFGTGSGAGSTNMGPGQAGSGGARGGGNGPDAGPIDGGVIDDGSFRGGDGGCGCRAGGSPSSGWLATLVLLLCGSRRRRPRR